MARDTQRPHSQISAPGPHVPVVVSCCCFYFVVVVVIVVDVVRLWLVHRLGLARVAVAVLCSGVEQLAVAIMRAERAKGRRGAHLCREITATARACACVRACVRACGGAGGAGYWCGGG